MSKYLYLLAVCLLGAMFAFAQASQNSPAPAQQSSSPSNQAQPQQPENGSGNAVRGNRDHAGANPAGQTAPGANNTAQTTQPAGGANHNGGIGWGWLIVAVIVGVIVISLLSRGRMERAPSLDHTADDERAREPDDIRRAG